MGMVRTGVDLELGDQFAPDTVFGQHALDGALDHLLWFFLEHFPCRPCFDTTRVSRVPVVNFVVQLVSGQPDLLGVDPAVDHHLLGLFGDCDHSVEFLVVVFEPVGAQGKVDPSGIDQHRDIDPGPGKQDQREVAAFVGVDDVVLPEFQVFRNVRLPR